MVADSGPVLGSFFGLEVESKGNAITRDSLTEFRALVADEVGGHLMLKPLNVVDSVQEALLSAFDTPVWQLAAGAWNKRDEIRKYADPVATPPDQINKVWLVEHKLSQSIHPVVEVRVPGVPIAVRLKFTVKVVLTFHGAVLVIRGGRITHVQLGDLTTKVSLAAGAAKLIERTVAKWPLPDQLTLGEGIRIPPPGTLESERRRDGAPVK